MARARNDLAIFSKVVQLVISGRQHSYIASIAEAWLDLKVNLELISVMITNQFLVSLPSV